MIIERRIITGLIVSTDYLRRVSPFWSDDLIESPDMRRVARWCLSYFEKYQRAPDRDIEQIFLSAVDSERIPKAEAQLIEDVLEVVSDEFDRGEQFNSAYLYDQTVRHFRERDIALYAERIADLRERGQLDEVEKLANAGYQPRSWAASRGLDLGTEHGYERVRVAFDQASSTPILRYPGAIGEFLNPHLIRDGFVSFMGREKSGKTFWLTDIVLRALRQKCNVAFFQAGDLTEGQFLRRVAVYLARRSNDPRYSASHLRPVGDCVLNQFDKCHDRPDRNCDHGIYDSSEFGAFTENRFEFHNLKRLSELAESDPGYRPCDSASCPVRQPCVWLERVPDRPPLTGAIAETVVRRFFERWKRRFRLVTYSNGTLTPDEMRDCLAEWERQDDFVPDVIAVDYADIMTHPEREFRHRQNEIWKGLRAISQDAHALLVTATQTDADSYKSGLLKMSNFSEDKRKYAHVTAMWGLNRDPNGFEEDLGVVRINTIVAREGAFNTAEVVHVMQHLAAGRAFTGSFRDASSSRHPATASEYDFDN